MYDVPTDPRDDTERYEIRVKGHLGARWEAWFDGFTLTPMSDGTTTLAGSVDQAALHGVLRKLADLGLPLLSVAPRTPAGRSIRTTHPR